MDSSIGFLYIVFVLSIVLYAMSGIIVAGFVIPLQIEQVGVKNGLLKLRKQMLIKGFLNLTLVIASIMALTTRFFINDQFTQRYLIVSMILLHAIGTLIKAFIDLKIYHQNYSPENKAIHVKIDKIERAQAKHRRAIDNPPTKR